MFMSALAELDRSKVVDIDLGSAEFKANAHRHVAEWARRPPFYVLGQGQPFRKILREAERRFQAAIRELTVEEAAFQLIAEAAGAERQTLTEQIDRLQLQLDVLRAQLR